MSVIMEVMNFFDAWIVRSFSVTRVDNILAALHWVDWIHAYFHEAELLVSWDPFRFRCLLLQFREMGYSSGVEERKLGVEFHRQRSA